MNAWKIYKITNKVNGKVYIGQTTKTLSVRFSNHCCPSNGCRFLGSAIKKYGRENFTIEEIDHATSQEESDLLEIKHIAECDSTNRKFGYNIEKGGDGRCIHSEETRRKISLGRKGKCIGHPFYGGMCGKHHTKDARDKISASKIGDKNPAYGKRYSGNTGMKASETTKSKMSLAHMGKPATIKKLTWYDAQAIRYYKLQLLITTVSIAKLFGVSTTTIRNITLNKYKCYKHDGEFS